MHAYADLRQELPGAQWPDQRRLWRAGLDAFATSTAWWRANACRACAAPAAVGLVTPLRDGMNLVAEANTWWRKTRTTPACGAVTLAGAAEQLKEALLVEPLRPQGMADSIQQALQMPLAERQARHQSSWCASGNTMCTWWRKAFMDALQAAAD